MALKFDWKDGLLLCAGFLGCIGVLVGLKQAFGVSADEGLVELVGLVTMAGPVGLRRLLFGAPVLPEPRRGAVASLLSMVGLLATIFGLFAFAGGALKLVASLREAPDYELEEREAAKRAQEQFAVQVNGLPVAVDPEDALRAEVELKASVALRSEAWAEEHARSRTTSLTVAGVGLLLVALGSLATWARYRPT